MKFKIAAILKILPYIFLSVILLAVPLFVLPHLKHKDTPPQKDISGLLSMWHIETFEGGSIARSKYLLEQMIELQKTHNNLLVSIKVLTIEEASNLIEQGILPDLVSFGTGSGYLFSDYAQNYEGKLNIKDEFIKAGSIDGQVKAVAYMTGGYVLMCNKQNADVANIDRKQKLSDNIYKVGYQYNKGKSYRHSVIMGRQYNLPLTAAVFNTDMTAAQDSVFFANTQYEAYEMFVNGKATMLLGTQRDMHRVLNRMSQNDFFEMDFQALSGFCDLVQYLAVTSKDTNAKDNAETVIEFLIEKTAQNNLTKCGMFGVDGNNYYTAAYLKDIEKALHNPLKTVNAFENTDELAKLHNLSVFAAKGDNNSKVALTAELIG